MDRKRTSEAFLAASAHWNKKQKLQHETGSIVQHNLPNESKTLQQKDTQSYASPIQLLYNPSYPENKLVEVNKDTVRVADLIGSADLQETFQFNFSVDLPFFLTFLHSSFLARKQNGNKQKKIMFITGSRLLDPDYEETESITSNYNICEVVADIPTRFGTHHTKMMINFFEDLSVEIVISSSNITRLDFGGLTQMVWRSGRLPQSGETIGEKGIQFKKDLIGYLNKYKKVPVDKLATRLNLYNFLSVDVELIASAPGKYNLQKDSSLYGYGSLYKALERNNLLLNNKNVEHDEIDNDKHNKKKHYNVLAQVSAISYPFSTEKWATAGIFTHLLCPLIFSKDEKFRLLAPGKESIKRHQKEHNYTPHIIFPTVDEVASSTIGYVAGSAIHFDYTRSFVHKNYFTQAIKPYLSKWDSSDTKEVTGRERVMPHVKLYMCDNADNWKTIKWCYMGSHNLSKQAWGSKKGNKFVNDHSDEYEVSSYELGVLFTPKEGTTMVPSYKENKSSIRGDHTFVRMPFQLPPALYSLLDMPWSGHVSYGDRLDLMGSTYKIGK